jgi:protein arginine kinase activator
MNERSCDGCGKTTGHIRVYLSKGNDFSELWLCETCAAALRVEQDDPVFGPIPSELLGALICESSDRTCPRCGTEIRAIRASGRVGCAECYRTFHTRIQQLLEQGGLTESHVGRYPARLDSYKRLLVDREFLKEELEDALHREDYETAAAIRDRIQALEEGSDARI